MALRRLLSGYPALDALWMWAALLALNVSTTLSALAKPAEAAETGPSGENNDEPAPWRRRHRPERTHGKRLRREIIMVPARVAHHARRLVVHLHPSQEGPPLLTAYASLVALPSFAPT